MWSLEVGYKAGKGRKTAHTCCWTSTCSRLAASLLKNGWYFCQKTQQNGFKTATHKPPPQPCAFKMDRSPPPALWAHLCFAPLPSCRLQSAALLRGSVGGVVSRSTGRCGKFAASDRSAALHTFHDRWISFSVLIPEWLDVENGTNPNTQPPPTVSKAGLFPELNAGNV